MNYAFLISATKVGGAPSRLEIEKADKELQRIQNTIHRPKLNRIRDVVLMDASNRGLIRRPFGMTKEKFLRGNWMLPISPSVDAFYDAKENIQMVRAGLESAQDVIAETNRNWEDVLMKGKQWAMRCSMMRQDGNAELENTISPITGKPYKADLTAADIAQISDNPQQAAAAENIQQGKPASGGEQKATAALSAFMGDVKIVNLPANVSEEIAKHIHNGEDGISDLIVTRYGMTVPELIGKADPHNLETARKNVRYFTGINCADEVHGNDEKMILIMNDRIIDGHHFLAKAEKGKVSKSIPVVDLSPVRFQLA